MTRILISRMDLNKYKYSIPNSIPNSGNKKEINNFTDLNYGDEIYDKKNDEYKGIYVCSKMEGIIVSNTIKVIKYRFENEHVNKFFNDLNNKKINYITDNSTYGTKGYIILVDKVRKIILYEPHIDELTNAFINLGYEDFNKITQELQSHRYEILDDNYNYNYVVNGSNEFFQSAKSDANINEQRNNRMGYFTTDPQIEIVNRYKDSQRVNTTVTTPATANAKAKANAKARNEEEARRRITVLQNNNIV